MNNLTIRDGFNFGCGFFIAALVYSVVIFIFTSVLAVIFGSGLLSALLQMQ